MRNPSELFNAYARPQARKRWRQMLREKAAGLAPPQPVCRHRDWSKFGVYSEDTFRRLVDDLC